MLTLLFIVAMFIGLVVQHFAGVVPGFGSQILLLPAVFLCGAAALPVWSMLGLAFVAGLMWDSLNFIPVEGRADFPFGGTIVLYAGMGALMNGLRPLYLRGWWQIHAITTGLLTSVLVLVEFLIITFRREPFALIWPREIWQRVGGSGLVAMFLAIPLFLILNWVGRRTGIFEQRRVAI
jgi:hypothetical protein